MISKAKIFNIALNILGVSTPLENAASDDNKAILLNNYYELARDYVLKDFDWNFASTFIDLSLAEGIEDFSNYQYTYIYPNDCICARDIFEKGTFTLQKFEIVSLTCDKKGILTNAKSATLRYTRRIDKEVFFTCEFSTALAYYLASLTSNVLTGSIQKGELAFEKYKQILARAKVLNAREGADFIYNDETYIDARG